MKNKFKKRNQMNLNSFPCNSVHQEDIFEEKQRKILIEQLPKTEDLRTEIKKAVKEIKKCYKYETYEKIQEKLTGKNETIFINDYLQIKYKSHFNYYVRFVGAIDRWLDILESYIALEGRVDGEQTETKNRQQMLLKLREKIVSEFHSATNQEELYSPLGKALNTYPTHSKIGRLYEIEKYGNAPSEHIINFDLAYKAGYISGKHITLEELKAEYDKSIKEINQEKATNQEEYNKQITRIRR